MSHSIVPILRLVAASSRLLLLGVCLCFVLPGARADRRVYHAPSALGNGSGSDAANARVFDAASVNDQSLGNSPDPVVELHFAPGIYSLRTQLFSPATGDREALTVRIQGHGERPEDTVIRNDKPLVWNAEDGMVRLNGLGRIEMENLTFDGNWEEKVRQMGHPALNPNYKNQPLNLTARTGRIRRVIVRNCGSIGYLPQTRFDNVAGTEAFPLALGTNDAGQEPAAGDSLPWLVEDCEIHGFHPEYGGYTTMLMAGAARVAGVTPAWARDDAGRRLILVRRCQVRGVAGGAGIIGLGSAGCGPGEVDGGRVSFSDNLILNASLGFNTDCGRLVNFEVVHSLFLDVWTLGNIGALYPGTMEGYQVSGNAVRLSGRAPHPTYLNYVWRGGRMVTDPTLVLGRAETNEVSGLGTGAAGRLRWEGNWFTTRPREQFAPEGVAPTFRVLRKYTSADTASAGGFGDLTAFGAAGNALSGVAWDFSRVAVLPGGRHAAFSVSTVPELTESRTVVAEVPGNFHPIGTVERVLPVFLSKTQLIELRAAPPGGAPSLRRTESVDATLAGAIEVSVGQPQVDSTGGLQLWTRLVVHPLPGAGLTGTVPLRGSNVWLEVGGPFTARWAGVTDLRGIAEFHMPSGEVKPGRLELRAYHDPEGRATARGKFPEYRVAFATATYLLGTVVSIESAVDFAQAGGQRARFRVHRTSPTRAEMPELEVFFRPAPVAQSARYGDEYALKVTGAVRSNLEALSHGGVGRLTLAAGDRSAAIEVIPLARASERTSLVQLRLVGGSAQRYAVDSRGATVVLHQGPEWSFEVLPAGDAGATRVAALGPVGTYGTDLAVFAVGARRNAAGSENGTVWRWRLSTHAWEDFSSSVPDFRGVMPEAVGRVIHGGTAVMVGNRTTSAGSRPWSNGGHTFDLPPGVRDARVTTMSGDAAWVAGVIGGEDSHRVVIWHQGMKVAIVSLPAGVLDAGPVAIDAEGGVVGNARFQGRTRAFKTGPKGAGPIEWLPGLDSNAEVRVSDLSPTGVAVGSSGTGTGRRAVAWWPGVATPLELGRPDLLPSAAALTINSEGEVVGLAGRDGKLTDLYQVSAVANGAWKPLQDSQFALGLAPDFEPGMPLVGNEQGWIAGNGRVDGRERAWVLRRVRNR